MLSDFSSEISQIKSSLTNAQNIVILTKENTSLDSLAGALALYLSLKNSRKSASMIYPADLTVEMSDLIGVDEVKKDFGGKNIIISWDYSDGAIEKVSYNIENKRFNLIIQPRENSNYDITADKIDFRKSGITADLIFLVGIDKFSALNNLYTQEQEMFSKVDIINIDKNISNENYGKINLVSPTASSISELIGALIMETGLTIDQDVVTNILTGIDVTTANLSGDNLKPEVLEIAAWCLKNGGVRLLIKKKMSDTKTTVIPNQTVKKDSDKDQAAESVPSPDWLQPKIYRGTSTA
ncbi:hypothetical protein HY030_02920 [Candidatus Gottesmanbacteria bacterium]|nr:hypothetical protein [Candidatus Gottesmanbacteria bacterium]